MDSKRRADLQRKLSMGAVPRPPAGLADRIKADIPKYLEAHPAPERFSWAATMRIAASILLLLTTALVTRELLEPRPRTITRRAVTSREKVMPAVLPLPQRSVADATSAPEGETDITIDISQEAPLSTPAAPPAMAAPRSRVASVETQNALANEESAAVADSAAFGRVTATAASAPPPVAESVQVTAAAPPVMAAPPLPAAPMPTAPAAAPQSAARDARAESEAAHGYSAGLVPDAVASSLDLTPSNVFGISIDPQAFAQVRSTIESGRRPRAGSVDIEAVVNYFAGSRTPRRGVDLEVEASPAPIAADGDRAILRFTVDTAKLELAQRGSTPPIARDARLHIEFDARAVANFRRIGDHGNVTSESALLYNTSVTGLYELELKPKLRSTQRIATVRLTYVSVKDGRSHSVARVINGRDLAKTWDRASRRHRLAALGALWSETLNGTAGATEVAKRAEELATENPSDARARELAAAASASVGGGR